MFIRVSRFDCSLWFAKFETAVSRVRLFCLLRLFCDFTSVNFLFFNHFTGSLCEMEGFAALCEGLMSAYSVKILKTACWATSKKLLCSGEKTGSFLNESLNAKLSEKEILRTAIGIEQLKKQTHEAKTEAKGKQMRAVDVEMKYWMVR